MLANLSLLFRHTLSVIVCVTEKYVRCPHVPAVNDALTSTRALTEKPFWWTRALKHVLHVTQVCVVVCATLSLQLLLGATLQLLLGPFFAKVATFPVPQCRSEMG
jgi:hypothetical protein